MRQRVEMMSAGGMTQSQMASVIGCDIDTLAKHFRVEIDTGPANRRKEALELLWASARKGNVSAQKAVYAIAEREAATHAIENAETNILNAEAEIAATPPKIGKKEQRQIDAETAGVGSEWGDDLHMGLAN